MKDLTNELTLKDILNKGGTLVEEISQYYLYEVGNKKYIVRGKKVIFSYNFNDERLRKYEKRGENKK